MLPEARCAARPAQPVSTRRQPQRLCEDKGRLTHSLLKPAAALLDPSSSATWHRPSIKLTPVYLRMSRNYLAYALPALRVR
jgi:hypothetical protein